MGPVEEQGPGLHDLRRDMRPRAIDVRPDDSCPESRRDLTLIDLFRRVGT